MADLRDELLKLSREELETRAAEYGLPVQDSMSRAELIVFLEKQQAFRDPYEVETFQEYKGLLLGLLFVSLGAIFLMFRTISYYFGNYLVTTLIGQVYLAFRALGGFIVAAAFLSIAFRRKYTVITPPIRVALIFSATLIIIVVVILIPYPIL